MTYTPGTLIAIQKMPGLQEKPWKDESSDNSNDKPLHTIPGLMIDKQNKIASHSNEDNEEYNDVDEWNLMKNNHC